ncbi:MAG: RluA family pseudouridine synthase [Eubacterium sp.]
MILPSTGQYDYHYKVDDTFTGTLKDMLMQKYDYSSRLLSQIRKSGCIAINHKDCWLDAPVHLGDLVTITFPKEKLDIKPIEGPLHIVYEDDEVIVLNKGPNCVTHPTKSHQEDTLANFIAFYWQKCGTVSKIRFVNRLDMDTTGLVIVAKNKYVNHYIQSRMKTDMVKKTYLAFVNGVPEKDEGTICAPIGRPSEDSFERIVMSSGKESTTHYKVLEHYKNAALLKLVLETGRTHQIRVHLRHIGYPIIGDSLYNCDENNCYGMKRQALHATQLNLILPKRGELKLTAELAEDLKELQNTLRKE